MFKKVAIIGGAGKMGTWFSKFFLKNKIEVIISDRNKRKLKKINKELKVKIAKNNIEAVKDADLILISVLLQNFEEVAREIAPHLKENQIVIDITSLKEIPVKIMKRYFKNNLILGTHPLFGPGAKETKQNFVLTPTNKKEALFAKRFKKWLKKRGFLVKIVSPKEHDKIMSFILGLPHFLGLVTGSFYANFNLKRLENLAGPSFQKLMELIKNVVFSDSKFYCELHFNLPEIEKLEKNFERKVKMWLKIVEDKNKKKFIKEMVKVRKFFENNESRYL